MTDPRRHRRSALRRSSTPERILSAGLATATCVGVVGLLGARTIEANATSESGNEQTEAPPVVEEVVSSTAPVPTTSGGLTQSDLDAYAADLAKEKERLDAYRAKLVRTAKKLKRQIAAGQATAAAVVPARPVSSGSQASSGSSSRTPAAKPQQKASKPAAATQPAPAAQPAPQPAAAPAPQPAPKPQSNTKSS
jgi:hypothetical protein